MNFIFAFFEAYCIFLVTFLALSRNLSNSRGQVFKKVGWGGSVLVFITARPCLLQWVMSCSFWLSAPFPFVFSLTHLLQLSGWEVIAEDETKEVDNHGSLTSLDISSPGMSGHKQGHGSSGTVGRAAVSL